jgi:hypothetical protein
VVGLQAHEHRLQQPLDGAHYRDGAAHVLEQQEPSPGTQHPHGFRHGAAVVRNRTQGKGADHRVKGCVGEIKRLCVAHAQANCTAQPMSALPGDREHRWAHVNTGEVHLPGVERQIAPGADCNLQDVAASLRADPAAAIPEE